MNIITVEIYEIKTDTNIEETYPTSKYKTNYSNK